MPILSLFAPLPLALMIPFMAAQSFAMGEAFGKGFQSGKRRISSMTNEQFNAKSQPQIFEETTADISAMIPSMKKQMTEFTFLQSDIIQELIGYIKKLPSDIQQGLTNAPASDPNADFLHSLGIGASGSSGAFESGDFARQSSENIKLQIELEKLRFQTMDATAQQLKQFSLLQASTQGVNLNTQITNKKIIVPTSVTETPSPNPNVSTETYDSNTGITTTYDNQGKILSVKIDKDKAPTAISTKAQTIVKDFSKPLPRAPRSIVTQLAKYNQEIISLNTLISRYKGRNENLRAKYAQRRSVVSNLMSQLRKKYQF